MSEWRRVTPVPHGVDATVRPPGSKSLTIRSLVGAALAHGESRITGPLRSDDTVAARRCLESLGAAITDSPETWVVAGTGGLLTPPGDSLSASASGLTARILLAIAPLVDGKVTVTGSDRLPDRPMQGVLEYVRRQGVTVEDRDGHLPATVHGTGSIRGGHYKVSGAQSSQFVTAALMAAPMATEGITLEVGEMPGSAGYVALTVEVMAAYGAAVNQVDNTLNVAPGGYSPTRHHIEPDASAAVYPMIGAAITGGRVEISGIGPTSKQPDYAVGAVLEAMGCQVERDTRRTVVSGSDGPLTPLDEDLSHCPDGAMAVAIACLFASGPSRLRGLGSLRYKESDRLEALANELNRVGSRTRVDGSSLLISPAEPRPAAVKTYGDHRMAMALALLGLRVDGIVVENPSVVDKTWPGFWDMLEEL